MNSKEKISSEKCKDKLRDSEVAINFLSETEKSIIQRRFLPYNFDEKRNTPEWQIELIKSWIHEIIGECDLLEKIRNKKDIIIKFGIDPTGDEIHVGHLIPIKHLHLFQALGYQIRFLIGTFTATIGDPDKKTTRQVLTDETIQKNISTYLYQVWCILNRDDPKMKIVYNKDWFGKWWADDLLWLAMKWKVGQMLQKQQFSDRMKDGQSIAIWEFIHPLLQWWDSVMLDADVELGGTDQKFNLLMWRNLQEWEWGVPQTVITFWLLNGFDGRKMSKTFANYVGIKPQNDMQLKINNDYGKLLSMTDGQMEEYFKYVVSTSPEERSFIQYILNSSIVNPLLIKKMLARTILRLFYSEEQTFTAENTFERIVSRKEFPDSIPAITLEKIHQYKTVIDIIYSALDKLQLLGDQKDSKRITKSELRRRMKGWWLYVNNEKLTSLGDVSKLFLGPTIIRYGKNKFITIKITD